MTGLLTPEEAQVKPEGLLLNAEETLEQYRAFDPASGDTAKGDWLANLMFEHYGVDQDYGAKGYESGGNSPLTPQEQMQIEWLRANKGQNSGNNKDDRIKRIRKENDMPNEYLVDGDKSNRYIVRNKIDKEGKADGMTSGDVYQIGGYTQSDTGKDDGLFQQVINKSLPGFDVGDVTAIPGIDYIAAAFAPMTGGISTAVLEVLKAAEAGEVGLDTVTAVVSAAGGWPAIMDQIAPAMSNGVELPTWMQDVVDYGEDIYDSGKEIYDDVANSEIIQQAQDLYGEMRDFTDPVEDIFGDVGDIFGDFDMGSLDDFLPEMTAPAATGAGFAMPQRNPLELLPLEYRQAYQGPVGLLNPFEAG